MFAKVRKKFILVAVSSVFLVLLLILGTVNAINYINIVGNSDQVISVLKENNGEFGSIHGQTLPPEMPFSTRYFTVTLSDAGDVLALNLNKIVSVSSEEAMAYARELLAKGKTSGFYGNFRYGTLEVQSGVRMYIFVDCFAELENLNGYEDNVQELILFRWNRVYPADLYFPFHMENWSLIAREEFRGSSHEKITMEVYRK